tara:strand:+ start:866 stop:1063 length:198 start_codon:yes stop_codon:yes gene_type:complete
MSNNNTNIDELDLFSQLLIRERINKDEKDKNERKKEFDEYYKKLEEIKITLPQSLLKFQNKNTKQ